MRRLLPLLLFSVFLRSEAQDPVTLRSPDGRIVVEVGMSEKLHYTVLYMGRPVVKDGRLGFEFRNEPAMGRGLSLDSQRMRVIDETWRPVVRSKHASIVDHCNEVVLAMHEDTGLRRRLDLELRVYDDGVAFRYKLYRGQVIGNRTITRELTTFPFPAGARGWVADYGKYTSSQETEFKPFLLRDLRDSVVAGLPFLVQVDTASYVAITEAVIDHYPGFYIGTDGSGGDAVKAAGSGVGAAGGDGSLGDRDRVNLATRLSPLPGEPVSGAKANFDDTLYTPWRVMMIASTPGRLIESEIVQNLNAPCAIPDPSWIKPGMSAWDHWWSGEVKVDMPTIKQYIDMAAEQGWPYMLVDWQWYGPFNTSLADISKPAPQLDMPALIAYARSKNVRLWLWLYSSDVNRNSSFEQAFAVYERWGIAGIKIDFMDRDDQQMVDWYHRIIRTAAAHHLMVDFHGAYKPDGIIRTWPNMITREGVMGEEYSKFTNRLTPEHNVTLPFTRMLAGQMDYTPGGFMNVRPDQFRQGVPTVVMNTRCAELAKFVIYESPFMVYCDDPSHLLGQPGADFLKIVPTVWDDIRVLGGYPGKFVSIAKRNGESWFLGAMTNGEARVVSLDLGFLPSGRRYTLTSWEDAKDADLHPTGLVKRQQTVVAGAVVQVKLAKGGGYAGYLAPVDRAPGR